MGLYDELLADKPFCEEKIYSVTTGVVKENWEDKHPGMVKVEYFLGEKGKSITGWIPVASMYTGNSFGAYFLPEVGTEVVIAFNMGERSCPIVISSLWNEKNKLPANTPNKENTIKSFQTKGGHTVVFSEEKDKEKIEVKTKGELTITLEDKNQIITIADKKKENKLIINGKDGVIEVSAKKKLELSVGNKKLITLESDKVTIKAGNVAIEGSQGVKIKGQTFRAEGSTAEIKANGSLKLEASGVTQVKGGMVKIN